MNYDFSQINLEIISINTNATPVIYVNQNGITFSRRILEDLNFPSYVQFCLDAEHRVFAIRACKGTEAKATPFSKPRAEQKTTLSCLNRNIHDAVACLIPNYNAKYRYRVEGQMATENKVIYYDMTEAVESSWRKRKVKSLSEQVPVHNETPKPSVSALDKSTNRPIREDSLETAKHLLLEKSNEKAARIQSLEAENAQL